MKHFIRMLLCLFLYLGLGISAYAEGFHIDVSCGVGKMFGDTTYRIGGVVDWPNGKSDNLHFPISELEFPLEVYMVSLNTDVHFAHRWTISLNGKTNITKNAGKMKDSDWGYYYLEGVDGSSSTSLDIYSESDAELEAWIFNFRSRLLLYESFHGNMIRETVIKSTVWSYFVSLGFMHQTFYYETRNLDQWYPSAPSEPHVYENAMGITYEVKYNIPYLELAGNVNIKERFQGELGIGYSPYVWAKDEDHHLLREPPITAQGDCDGDAVLLSMKGKCYLFKGLYLTLGIDFIKINTDGKQENFINGQWIHTTDEEISSEQAMILLNIGYLI